MDHCYDFYERPDPKQKKNAHFVGFSKLSIEKCQSCHINRGGGGGGAGAQSVERATPGQEVPGSIPAVASRSLLVGSVSV